jgi:hypothetical protein
MGHDPLTQALGGEEMVAAIFGLAAILSLIPQFWPTLFGMLGAVVRFAVRFVGRRLDDALWYLWTKPRLERAMWRHEMETRQTWGGRVGSPLPRRFQNFSIGQAAGGAGESSEVQFLRSLGFDRMGRRLK